VPILDKHGIVMMQAPLKTEGGYMHLQTRLVYVGNDDAVKYPDKPDIPVEPNMVEFVTSLPVDKNTPQAAGSAITYMRRYALVGFFTLIADNDDDGNAASIPDKKVSSKQLDKIKALAKEKEYSLENMLMKRNLKKLEDMSEEVAAALIEHLNGL
jgi:ERF superfamily